MAWPSSAAATHKVPKRRTHTVAVKSNKVSKHKSAKPKSKYKSKAPKKRRARRSYQQAPTAERYKDIQRALAEKGYLKSEPNGEWGPDSVDALKRFQADQNLTPDGKLSALSLIALGLGPKRMTAQSQSQPAVEAPKTDIPQ